MAQAVEPRDARLLRMRGMRLLPSLPADSAVEAVRASAGLQAQSWPAAILGVRPRTRDVLADDVERARAEDRTLVRSWFMRGTLHLVPSEDAAWLLALLGPVFVAAYAPRRRQLGLDEDTYATAVRVLTAVVSNGPRTRSEIAEALVRAQVPIDVETQALAHLIQRAALEGRICYGPKRGREQALVLLRDWIDPGEPMEPEAALVELARRYLDAFGPATPLDFSKWSGLPMSSARAAFDALGRALAEVEVEGRPMWLPRASLETLDSLPAETAVRLLPAFDTYLLGLADRSTFVDHRFESRVWHGGVIDPVVIVDGRIVATWKAERRSREARVRVSPLEGLDDAVRERIEDEAEDVGRYLSVPERLEFAAAE